MTIIWQLPTNGFHTDKNHTYTIDSNSWIKYPFRSIIIIPSIGTKSIGNEFHILAINVINCNLRIARCLTYLLCKYFRFQKVVAMLINFYSKGRYLSDSYHPNSVIGRIFVFEKGIHIQFQFLMLVDNSIIVKDIC